MSQVVKFPDMRPPPRPKIAPLPPLSEYRQIKPTLATKDTSMEITPVVRRFQRKKLFIWFGVAVALHAALLLAFFLTPPMRIKWTPPPQDWVPVVSLPKPEPVPVPQKPAPQAQAVAPAKPAKHSAANPKNPHLAHATSQAQPSQAQPSQAQPSQATPSQAQP
jgi:hypothetical protein